MRVPLWLRMTAALWAAVFLLIVLTLPPRTRDASGFHQGHVRRGAFHVHTTRSDGGGTREDVARAAAAAGLDFVILSDHGDGTAPPAPPEYLHSVLIIDGFEVTTSAGHYAVFGASQSPYPLGGPPYAVIEDVARLGGAGIAAHPDSVKPALRWRDWNAAIDGFEWINGDSAWRDESAVTLGRGLINYFFRPAPALASMVSHPSRLLQRLDDMSRSRRVIALAAADAHARLPLTGDDEPYDAWTVPAPSYANSFRTFANLVETGQPISGDAAKDAAAIVGAIREGRVAFAMTALARPAELHFAGLQYSAPWGDLLVTHPSGSRLPAGLPVTFEARTSEVAGDGRSLVRLSLVRDGRVVASSDGPSLSHHAEDATGVWRVEATIAHAPGRPWILSNPIVVGEAGAPPAEPPPSIERTLDLSGGTWVIEKHAASEGSVAAEGPGRRFRYALAGGTPSGQYAAAVRATDSSDAWDSVVLTASAPEPTRFWVQLRLTDSGSGQRWGRSVYVDSTSRTLRLPIRSFAPLEPGASSSRPNVVQVRAVLMVVDTVNTQPGRGGQILIERIGLERTAAR